MNKQLIICLFITNTLHAQTKAQPFVHATKYSFFDTSLNTKLKYSLQIFKKNTTSNALYDLSNSFYEINNKWISIQNYGIVQLENSNIIYPIGTNSGDYGRNFPQLLNDTLMLIQDGSILDLASGKLLYDTIANKYSLLKINRSSNQFDNKNHILKTDIFNSEIKTNNGNYYFLFNLLSNSVNHELPIHNSVYSVVFDNPNSKYLLTKEGFLNRYNVNELIKIPRQFAGLFQDYNQGQGNTNIAYNDSLMYFAIEMDGRSKLLRVPFNKTLDFPLSFDDIEFNNNDEELYNIKQFFYDSDRQSNIIETWYFHKKYNKYNLKNNELAENENYYNTYKSLLAYKPNLIIEYNYLKGNVVSIIDAEIYPLREVNKIFIDNTNRFLITQQVDDSFTIFDLIKKREIVTLYGSISNINYKNELLLNVGAKRSNINFRNYGAIVLIKLDLSELQNISESSFIMKNIDVFNFNEFTSKSQFNSTLDAIVKKSKIRMAHYAATGNRNKMPNEIYYSNNFIKNEIARTINRYYDTIYNNIGSKILSFPLEYSSYSQDAKIFQFNTVGNQVLSGVDRLIYANGRGKWAGQKVYMDASFKHDFRKDYSGITLSDVTLDQAIMFKKLNHYFVKKSYTSNYFDIPPLNNIFIFKHFTKIKDLILSSKSFQDQNLFFNRFVPFDSNIESNYDAWFFGTSKNLFLIHREIEE